MERVRMARRGAKVLEARLRATAVVQNQDNREHDLLDRTILRLKAARRRR